MRRRYNWIPIVLILAAILGYRVVWPWYRDRPARAAADALIADLDQHGKQVEQKVGSLPDVPERPARAELEAQFVQLLADLGEATDHSHGLVERVTEALPRTPADKQEELRRGLEQYNARIKPALASYKARGDVLRKKVEEFKARGKAGAGA